MHIAINDKVFDKFPLLESKRLLYRNYQTADAPFQFAMRTHPRVMKYLDTAPYQSVDDALKMIVGVETSFHNKESVNWVIIERESQQQVGYCGFWRMDRKNCRGEIGYSLHPDYWGKGYMAEALQCIISFAFQELHLHSIEANVNIDNQASKNVLQRLGFQQEAYFRENYLYNGQFIDSAIFCLLEKDMV